MGLLKHVQKQLVRVQAGHEPDLAVAIIELAGAILDLEEQLKALARKVEHAELLAGRHAEEPGP